MLPRILKRVDEKMRDEKMRDEKMRDEKMKDEKMKDEKMKDEKMKDEKMKDEKVKDEKVKDEKLKQDAVDACLEDTSVVACLKDAEVPFSSLDSDATTAEQCAVLGPQVVAQFQCMKQCEQFSCETDAESFVFSDGVLFKHEFRCGGLDYEATCNAEVLTNNGAPAMIPSDCLDDQAVRECRDEVSSDGSGCKDIVEAIVNDTICLSKCETFDCSGLQEFHDFFELSFVGGECEKIDLEESCIQGQVVGAADGLRVGASVFLAIGAMVVRMLN